MKECHHFLLRKTEVGEYEISGDSHICDGMDMSSLLRFAQVSKAEWNKIYSIVAAGHFGWVSRWGFKTKEEALAAWVVCVNPDFGEG